MRQDRKDIIAIPTFNRVHNLLAFSKSLCQLRGLDRYRIFIRDDASSEFDTRAIALVVPQADRIERNDVNLGPDASQMLLFRDCIEAGARRIIVLDSDMLVSPSLLEFTEQAFDRTDGFLGLYNSTLHQKRRDVDNDLVEKWSAGGTATCWEAGLLDSIVEQCKHMGTSTWDTTAVAELIARGRRILVSRRSYAQHLGFRGSNNGIFGHIDYGLGFVIETEVQTRFMAESLDHMMSRQMQFIRPKRKRRFSRLLEILRRSQQ